MSFQNPEAFFLLLLLAPLIFAMWRANQNTIQLVTVFKGKPPSNLYHASRMLLVTLILISLVTVTARPFNQLRKTADILFLVDVSRSMQARKSCSQPSYLDRAKTVMRTVVAGIPEARFGIFAFERLTFPVTQLTFDHTYLDAVIENGIYDGLIFDRTATHLGNAFSIITNKKQNLPDLYKNVKYVVLLSDGNLTESYKAQIDEPLLELVQVGVTVLPVGIGNTDTTGIPIKEEGKCVDKFIVKDDNYISIALQTDVLQHIATTTKGSYFGEADVFELVNYLRNNALEDIFVDAVTTQRQKNDMSWIFLLIATIAMLGYMILDTNVDLQIKKYLKKILHRS